MMEIPSPTSINQIEDGNSKLINILPGVYYFEGDHNMGVYLVEDDLTLIDTQEEEKMSRNLNIIERIIYVCNTESSTKYQFLKPHWV